MHGIRLTDPRAIDPHSAIRRRQRGGGRLLERTSTAMTGVRLVGSRQGVEGPQRASRAVARTASTEELTRTTSATNRRRSARERGAALSPVPSAWRLAPDSHASFSPPAVADPSVGGGSLFILSVPPPRRGVRFPTPPNVKRG